MARCKILSLIVNHLALWNRNNVMCSQGAMRWRSMSGVSSSAPRAGSPRAAAMTALAVAEQRRSGRQSPPSRSSARVNQMCARAAWSASITGHARRHSLQFSHNRTQNSNILEDLGTAQKDTVLNSQTFCMILDATE